jgi:drug/metabolite transporter (DMT)-like permease
MYLSITAVFAVASGGTGLAAEPGPIATPDSLAADRDGFFGAAIVVMMLCGLASYFLQGRASEKTHVALASLVVLVGAFALLVLFGPSLHSAPWAAALIIVALIGLFKLMNQIEIRRNPNQVARRSDAAKDQS